MAKWLAAGGLVLLVLVIALWYQMQGTTAVAAPTPKPEPVAKAEPAAVPAPLVHAAAVAAEAKKNEGKVSPASDEFFNRFTEQVPWVVTGNAMRKCYTGGLHRRDRDAFLTVEFIDTIKDGEVTISNVRVKKSELNDTALEACLMAEIAKSHWHDDTLPDISQPDEVTINPERIAKKYIKDPNWETQGALAPPNTPR